MSWLRALFGRKKSENPFDPNPGFTNSMPARPYRVLHADLPFYSDPECRIETRGARLVVLRCEDPAQQQRTIECMPVLKNYRQGEIVQWDTNHKRVWDAAWYVDPDSGANTKAWAHAVEFRGRIYRNPAKDNR